MAPGLAKRHPEIKTYNGRGITDRAATIHADLSPLGFRASVRSANGSWYIDPYYVGPDSGVYASYWARHVSNPRAENLDTVVETLGQAPEIQKDLPTSTGDQLRTYRLAMITDPGYSTYHGGPGFVTAAKVTLMNRVSQVYEDDMTIRLQLVANNDLLNFNDWDKATAPNGPCGAARCFTQAQVTGCTSTTRARYVIGQVIGASNYEIGHLALGQPGGGVAGVGGRRLEQGRRLHRHPDAGRRLLRRRLRRPRDGPPVLRRTTRSTATSSIAPAATAAPRTRSSPAPASRSWPTRASA